MNVKKAAIGLGIGGAGLLLLLSLVWTATYFYWQNRIRSAFHVLQSRPPGKPDQKRQRSILAAQRTLSEAGCRCLPYAIADMDATKDAWDLGDDAFCVVQILGRQARGNPPDPEAGKAADLVCVNSYFLYKSIPERKRNCEQIRAWWDRDGYRFHQWWRVWSSSCPGR